MKAGARIETRSYTEDVPWRPTAFTGTAKVPRVLAEVEAGATAVLQGLHLNWTAAAIYCRELEALLEHPVQANAYLTPRRSQGLPVHHDTHDVFVLQVAGSKRWLVYEPLLELPLKDQRYSPDLGVSGEPTLDVTLRAGDTLYLPRGWLHEALTSADDSLHVTIGVNAYTWLDALRDALERCGDDVAFRRAVRTDGDGGAELRDALAARLEPGEVADAMRERFVRTRRPILDGQLDELRRVHSLAADATVARRSTVVADFDGAVLAFEGKRLTFPAHARAEVEALVAAEGPVRLRELPGRLDAAGRLVLARRLVREGFLRVVG